MAILGVGKYVAGGAPWQNAGESKISRMKSSFCSPMYLSP